VARSRNNAASVAQLVRAVGEAQPIASRSASARRIDVAQRAQPAASAFSKTHGSAQRVLRVDHRATVRADALLVNSPSGRPVGLTGLPSALTRCG